MWHNNKQIDIYRYERPLKRHELRMLELLGREASFPDESILDVGCATGAFTRALAARYSQSRILGIDVNSELIELARKRSPFRQVEFQVDDAVDHQPARPYDVIIASGVLGLFEEFETPISRWMSWLNPNGRLYIFGNFNSRDIDTIVRFRNNFVGGGWESGLTTYSVHTVSRFLDFQNWEYEFNRFELDIDLPKHKDPIRTFSVRLADGSKTLLTGANTVIEPFFLRVRVEDS